MTLKYQKLWLNSNIMQEISVDTSEIYIIPKFASELNV